jgi:hypothetical protein
VGRPVVSLDYALFFDGVDAEEQPGANVRRIPGGRGRPGDDELLSYYAELFDRYGGSVHGRWQAGIAGATPAGEVARETAEVGRTFVSKPCAARVPGFPLASLQLVGERYVAELDERREAALIRETLCHPLVTVVEQVLSPRALGERRS